jgi:hypothetical protein
MLPVGMNTLAIQYKMLSVHADEKKMEEMNMKNKPGISGLLALVGLLVIGMLFVPIVSANDLSTVGSDLPALLSGQQNLKSVEFIVRSQDDSTIWGYRDATICTGAISDIETGLTKAIGEMESNKVNVVQAVVTGDYGKERISFQLNLKTGKFERLATPVPTVRQESNNKDKMVSSGFSPGIVLSVAGLINTAGNGIPSGQSVTYWAHSVTSPTKTYTIMSTTAELHKLIYGSWNNIVASDGATKWYVSNNNRDPPAATGLQSGSYRSYGQFSGVRDDGSNYSDPDVFGGSFTIS